MMPPLCVPPSLKILALAAVLIAMLPLASPVLGQTATPTPTVAGANGGAAQLQEAQRLADGGETDAALAAFRRAIQLYRAAADADGEVGARFFLALYLRKLDRCAEALPEYQAAFEPATRLHSPLVQGSLWLGIGDCRGLLGNSHDALAAYEEAARLFMANQDDVSQRSAVSAFNSAGNTLHALGRYGEAAGKFEAALPIAAALNDQRAEMMLRAGLGNAYTALKEHEKALAAFSRCQELAEALGDRQWQQVALQATGGAKSGLFEYEGAHADFAAAAAIAHERSDVAGEAMLRMDAGLALHDIGRYADALGELDQALALEQRAGNRAREGLALAQIAAALEGLSRNTEALTRYEAARDIAGELQDQHLAARVNNDLGLLYDLLGRGSDAEAALAEALRAAMDLGDPRLEAIARNNQGTIANHRGNYAQAETFYNEALDVFRKVDSEADQAVTLNNLAQNYDSQGRYDEAWPLYERALAIHRRLSDPVGEATVRQNMAGQDVALGRYAQALEGYRSSLAVFEARGLLGQQATGLSNLGTLYTTLGRLDDARKSYEQALGLRRRIGDRAGQGIVQGNLAALSYEAGDYEAALSGYREAAATADEVGDPSAAATWQNHVGAVLSEIGRHREAQAAYQAAFDRFQAMGDQAGEAAALNGLGLTAAQLSAPEAGLTYLDQALALYVEMGEIAGQAIALSNKAYVLQTLDRDQEALDAYRRSLDLREQLRGAAPGEELRLGLTQDTGAVYDAAATLSMKLGRGEEAFSFTERARSRQLLDQLNAGRVDLPAGHDGESLAREQALRSEISRLDRGVREERVKPSAQRNAQRLESLRVALGARQAEYAALLADIKSRNPQYASMVSAEPASLAQIQALLPPDITLVDYYIGVENSLAFVIQSGSFQAVTLQAPAVEVWKQVAAFRTSFSDLGNPSSEPAAWLSDRLIAPVAPYLTTPVVGFVPHGPLHYVPFAALDWMGTEPASDRTGQKASDSPLLADRFIAFSLPSVSVLPYLALEAPEVPGGSALIMAYARPAGLPPLQQADAEASAVAEALEAEPRTGEAATESALRELAPGQAVIHIAAHGQLNSNAPLFSRLFLAPDDANDGALEVHEIYGLDLKNAGLVTLSACQTDMGKLDVGDDVTGLSRAFFFAGARSVVASLWSVDDEATAALMRTFYKNLAAGMGKAQALAASQASVRDDPDHPEWRHPYYWAAFVLNGDPGVTVQPKRGVAAGVLDAWWVPATALALVAIVAVVAILSLRARRRML